MRIPRRELASVLTGVILLGASTGGTALAQAHGPPALGGTSGSAPVGKKRGGAGVGGLIGKKNRITGDFYDRLDKQNGGAPHAAKTSIRLGDRVRGVSGRGVSHRIAFLAVKGARITLRVSTIAGSSTPVAHLSVPGVGSLVKLARRRPGDATVSLENYVLTRTGRYELLVSFPGNAIGRYLVETRVRWPVEATRDLDLRGRRPAEVVFGGVPGREIDRLEAFARGDDDVDLYVSLVDPAGRTPPLGDALWRAPDGRRAILRHLPMETPGDWRVRVMDRKGSGGRVKVRIVFRNPRPGVRLIDL